MCSVKTFGLSRPLSVIKEYFAIRLRSSKSHRIGAFKLQLRVGKEKKEVDFLEWVKRAANLKDVFGYWWLT